jgi:Rho-type GTPase-activating protein 1/2
VAPGLDLLDQTILITRPPPQLHYPADELPWNPSPVDIDNDTMSFADMQDSVILLHSTEDQLPTAERASMLSVPLPNIPGESRRKHYDEGVRPLQAFFGKQQQQTLLSPAGQTSLSIPSGLDILGHTPKSEKRRSINPIYKPSTPNQLSNDGSHSVRSPSPDSTHTAYYSPAVSPDDGRSSPLREAQNRSRSRSPSPFANHYSVPHLVNGDEERIEAPPSSRSFPPRGKSLPSSQPLSKTASSASTSTIRPLPKIGPSIPSQTPSSHSHNGSLPSNDPPPSPKGDPEDPLYSPSSPAFSDNSESALQNPRLLEAPALPPMRFSSGPEKFKGFAADILKAVSDSEPRVPRPRDSSVLTKSLNQTPDGGQPPSPSQEAARRITSLIESKSTPIVPYQHSGSSGESEDSLRIRKDSDTSVPNSVSQPSTPNHPHTRSFHQAQSSESTPIVARPPRKSSSASDHLNGGMLGESYSSLSNGSVVSLVPSLRPSPLRNDPGDLAGRRLREALNDATARNAKSVKLDPELAEAVLKALDGTKEMYSGLKGDMDQIKVRPAGLASEDHAKLTPFDHSFSARAISI